MKRHAETLEALFIKLSLPNDELSIRRFARTHHLNAKTLLPDADFWDEKQVAFICEALWLDSKWAEPLDKLDKLLRK